MNLGVGVGIHGEPGYKKRKRSLPRNWHQNWLKDLSEGFQLKAGERYGLLLMV